MSSNSNSQMKDLNWSLDFQRHDKENSFCPRATNNSPSTFQTLHLINRDDLFPIKKQKWYHFPTVFLYTTGYPGA